MTARQTRDSSPAEVAEKTNGSAAAMAEIADLLLSGLQRLAAHNTQISLDISAQESVRIPPADREAA